MNQTLIKPYREVTNKELGLVRLNLHPGQQRARQSKRRIIVILAGLQSGKTCFMPDWLEEEVKRNGEGDYLVITATFPILNLKLLPEFRSLFEDIRYVANWQESKKVLQFRKNKTRIIFGSADNPESVESSTAKAAVLDECGQSQFKAGTWIAVNGRLSLSQGRILMATSLYNFGWLKTQVYDAWEKGDPDIDVIQFESIMNPAFPLEEFERQRRLLPPWLFAMRYQGRYEKPAGMIYDCFDSAIHVKDIKVSPDWPVYSGHDFGSANPAALFAAAMPSGEKVVFDEYLPGAGYSPREHIQNWKNIVKGRNLIYSAGGSHQEEETRIGYAAQGWPISEPAIKGVDEGILKVYSIFKDRQLFITPNCVRLIDQIGRYSHKLDENSEPTDEIEDKSSFHLLDALRGMCSYFPYTNLHITGRSRNPLEGLVFPRI